MKRSFCDRISIKDLPRAIRRKKERKKEGKRMKYTNGDTSDTDLT